MIAELVKQYDTLKRCGFRLPDPYFKEMPVSLEIRLKSDGSFDKVDWLCKPKNDDNKKKSSRKNKEEPCRDIDCPVTERSSCRSSGNDSPHGLVDNSTWIFGELFATSVKTVEKKKFKEAGLDEKTVFSKLEEKAWIEEDVKTKPKLLKDVDEIEGEIVKIFGQQAQQILSILSPKNARRNSYLNQLKDICDDSKNLVEVCHVKNILIDKQKRQKVWDEVLKILNKKIERKDKKKWLAAASKANIRWVVEEIGSQGRPVHALDKVKKVWVELQKRQNTQMVISILDGQKKTARTLHPRIKGASLISFNDPSTYCGHLHSDFSKKSHLEEKENPKSREEDEGEDGSALPAQIGFEEAEKYSMALNWLVNNSSVKFGNSTNCIWVNQSEDVSRELDNSAYGLVQPQGQKSFFLRGKAKKDSGQTLVDSGDLIEAMCRFRNAQTPSYRNKRFYLLSMLLRNKGRHAVLGAFSGTMGELENNADHFIKCSSICLPKDYFVFKDDPRDFCPTLMDILDVVGVKSQEKKKLVWDREVVEVIVRGRPLPPDLCRLVVLKAIQQKFQEQSKESRLNYRGLLAIAAGCSRHYLNRISGKGVYDMGLNISITDPGYLAGRLFAVCENVQKRGRNWGVTLSDKLFAAGIERPRDTLGQLYQNCLCYEIYKKDNEWFNEIFDKVKLKEDNEDSGAVMPTQGVDAFEFLLGYWHQRCALKTDDSNNNDKKEETQSITERKES